ncbi:MAG: type I-C CRISPR-associated protein Cas5c [Deltaproteobacteria bacterium]|nr:type I-C CRISPR-associated protein Cas5c [Deltaproteobacteria bacterium]
MERSPSFRVRIRGPMACFTRPEFKAERVSYEVITPSAARGILEAVLWKPAIRWIVESIEVLAPIQFTSFKRNEVNDRATRPREYFADDKDNRAQRHTLALRDVDYVIVAYFEMTKNAGEADNVNKFIDMFSRRLVKGQHFHQPYLGCREFAADVLPADGAPNPFALTKSLGLMLYDLAFTPGGNGAAKPFFFSAYMQEGRVGIPHPQSIFQGGG